MTSVTGFVGWRNDEESIRSRFDGGVSRFCGVCSGSWLGLRGAKAFRSSAQTAKSGALVCWLNLHWWRQLPTSWGVRRCRVCQREEQAMYDALTGMYWVRL